MKASTPTSHTPRKTHGDTAGSRGHWVLTVSHAGTLPAHRLTGAHRHGALSSSHRAPHYSSRRGPRRYHFNRGQSFIPPLRRSMVSPCRWSRGEGGLVPEPGITGVAWSARTDVSDRPERRRL